MYNKLVCLLSLGLMLASAGVTSAALVAEFNADSDSGSTAFDSLGQGHNGALSEDMCMNR
jgi:hypothetical protein